MKLPRSARIPSIAAIFGIVPLVFLPLAACQGQPVAAPAETEQPGAAVAEPSGVTGSLPASEYFETLTETAFSATPAQLDATIAQARAAVARDRRTLSPPVAALLDERLRQIADAREGLNRADLAIASIEAFRLVVSATSTAGGVPLEVSLLDYAGFRYGADLKAPVVRWDDAAQAADFAAEQWALISARVSDQALRSRFGAAVAAMAASARNRDAAGAALAGATELDLVDELETFFAHG